MNATLTSRYFNQNFGRAKLIAKKGPVIITDRGKPVYVLLNIDDYRKLTVSNRKVSELLSMPADDYFDFEIPKNADLITSAENPRAGWDKASQRIASINDDYLVLPEFANESDAKLAW